MDYGEVRKISIGIIQNVLIAAVVHRERIDNSNKKYGFGFVQPTYTEG